MKLCKKFASQKADELSLSRVNGLVVTHACYKMPAPLILNDYVNDGAILDMTSSNIYRNL
jgi:hypothetical protein